MALRSLVPFVHVADLAVSIAFYGKLGFQVKNTWTHPSSDRPTWAWLQCDDAHLMIAKSSGPIVPDEQAVFFYLYADDVAATHAELRDAGIEVGEITYAFYAPRGEFFVRDPDGYGLRITHVGQ
jgi:catechol 2,3-dioxygenase-like lactoylglutathione lyase family enzyme